MPNTRSRKLTVVLAAGALTMFGAASAVAAEQAPVGPAPSATPADHGGGEHGGGGGGGGDDDPPEEPQECTSGPECDVQKAEKEIRDRLGGDPDPSPSPSNLSDGAVDL